MFALSSLVGAFSGELLFAARYPLNFQPSPTTFIEYEGHITPAHRPRQQSWDQETLKSLDHGCPTAIFAAPGGELVQC